MNFTCIEQNEKCKNWRRMCVPQTLVKAVRRWRISWSNCLWLNTDIMVLLSLYSESNVLWMILTEESYHCHVLGKMRNMPKEVRDLCIAPGTPSFHVSFHLLVNIWLGCFLSVLVKESAISLYLFIVLIYMVWCFPWPFSLAFNHAA